MLINRQFKHYGEEIYERVIKTDLIVYKYFYLLYSETMPINITPTMWQAVLKIYKDIIFVKFS